MLGPVSGLGQKRSFVWFWSVAVLAAYLLVVGHLPAAPQTAASKPTPIRATNRPELVFVETALFAPGPLAERFPQGARIVRFKHTCTSENPVLLTGDFFAAADPQVSFDMTKILFSGQKTRSDHWQIWEMDADGSNKRQVTRCNAECLRGAYLPVNEIAFTVEESGESYLAVANADGSQLHRITFGPAPFQLETVLRDGRIVASAPWPLLGANETKAPRSFYTLRPDGTALESFRSEHRSVTVNTEATELEDGSLAFVREADSEAAIGGELTRVRLGQSEATAFGIRQGVFVSPRQLSPEELVVSKEETSSNGSSAKFNLYSLNAKTGVLGERIFADEKLSSIQAVPIEPRDVPKHYWSTLNPESKTGYFICLNSYSSADVPRQHIAEMIAAVRVLTASSSDGKERTLGEAPVESDGSFYVQVPANTPVRFVLLDAKGKTIREERGWSWTRPGEERGCPGCHADKALAPENRWPLTLKRFDTPTPLGEVEHGSATPQAK